MGPGCVAGRGEAGGGSHGGRNQCLVLRDSALLTTPIATWGPETSLSRDSQDPCPAWARVPERRLSGIGALGLGGVCQVWAALPPPCRLSPRPGSRLPAGEWRRDTTMAMRGQCGAGPCIGREALLRGLNDGCGCEECGAQRAGWGGAVFWHTRAFQRVSGPNAPPSRSAPRQGSHTKGVLSRAARSRGEAIVPAAGRRCMLQCPRRGRFQACARISGHRLNATRCFVSRRLALAA